MSVIAILLTMTIVPWTQLVAAAPADDALLTIPTGTGTYYVVVCRNFVAIDLSLEGIQHGPFVSDCTNSGIYMESNGVDGAQIYSAPDASYAGDTAVLPP